MSDITQADTSFLLFTEETAIYRLLHVEPGQFSASIGDSASGGGQLWVSTMNSSVKRWPLPSESYIDTLLPPIFGAF